MNMNYQNINIYAVLKFIRKFKFTSEKQKYNLE
jgi:hypothetical protein